ncbi:MAG: histidine kinase [Ilumatobacteraceae bacterium]
MSGSHAASRRRLRAALQVTLLVVAAGVVVVCALLAASMVTGELPGDGRWQASVAIAGCAAGCLLWPIGRRAAADAAERVLRGGQRSPEDVVRTFGSRAREGTPVDELLGELVEALSRIFALDTAEVWREQGGLLSLAASVRGERRAALGLDPAARRALLGGGVVGRAWLDLWAPDALGGRAAGDLRVVPVTHAGALLGLIVVTRRDGAGRFGADDDLELAELGNRLGVVLHNRELDATLQDTLADLRRSNAELRASRVRLVSAADAERQRIERNLHDGAQQHLVALGVNIRLAADEIEADPSTASAVLSALADEAREASATLRSLAHGIYPPLLIKSGLTEALRSAARRSPSPVTVTFDGVGRYPSDIEATVYFCCSEALANAAKHAPGAPVHLHLAEQDSMLRFEVVDEGAGFDPSLVPSGHGLVNMADRTGAVGGTLSVERRADGSGTVVVGTVPTSLAAADPSP